MNHEIKQTVTFSCDSKTLFDILTVSKLHQQFSGYKAKIEKKEGGAFHVYNPFIEGYTLKLGKNKLIVQAWRRKDWPEEVFSIVTYKIVPLGKNKTQLKLTHSGIPARLLTEELKNNWKEYYWKPIKKILAQKAQKPSRVTKKAA